MAGTPPQFGYRSSLVNTQLSCQINGMLFATKRLDRLERDLERVENGLEHLRQTWEQQRIALLDLQETASHLLSRLAQRHKRQLKACTEDAPAGSASTEPNVDEITARILERRRKSNVQASAVSG